MTMTPDVAAGTPLADYAPLADRYDEMVDADGRLRQHWGEVGPALDLLGMPELRRRRAEISRLLDDDGVHYHVYEDVTKALPEGHERRRDRHPWRLDPVPVVIAADEWTAIERGIVQRAELLDAVLDDLYGPQDLVRRGLIHPAIIHGHPGFLRPVAGARLPGPAQLVNAAFDLARDENGLPVVVADRAQAPSGAGYALENRLVISRVFPSLYRSAAVHRLAPFVRAFRAALQATAPKSAGDQPRIAVLSPGPWNETAFEHAFLANELGFSLVEGSDLVVRGGRVLLRTLDSLEPVDVILRRVDASWCDPLELRPDSQLGVPGLVDVIRRGNVSVVNPLGSGVLENPALMAALPALAEHVLAEPLLLPSVATWWCGEDDGLRHVLANLDTLVLKPIARGTGRSIVHGGRITKSEQARLRARIQAEPHLWTGQLEVHPATSPVVTRHGLEPRATLLRTFVVAHEDTYLAMPGALTRVGARDEWIVSNQAGSISKDTWVVSSEPEKAGSWWLRSGPAVAGIAPRASMSSRAAENLFWFGRYAERAESVVRFLRTVTTRRLELTGPTTPAQRASVEALLHALTMTTGTFPGFVGSGTARPATIDDPDRELHALATDRARRGSLAHAIDRMADAAQVVRDQLSNDMWIALTTIEREVSAAARVDPTDGDGIDVAMYGRILQGLLAIQGLAGESMVRDPGWRFMDAGRRVERSLNVLGLVRSTLVDERDVQTDSLVLESVLGISESIVTYRRRYRSTGQLATALELLLFDTDNPRSLANQLDQLTRDLQALPTHPGPGRISESERPVLAATTLLRLTDPAPLGTITGGRRPALDTFLDDLITQTRRAAEVIDARHFTHLQPQRRVALGDRDVVEMETES